MAGSEKGRISGLTGIRFLAAALVLVSHALTATNSASAFAAFPRTYALIEPVAGIGMTLFFVLSGFVIHYNYSDQVERGGAASYWNFFVARFARLYPLYIVLLSCDLFSYGTIGQAFDGSPTAQRSLLLSAPYYLTLTQTWIYMIIGQHNLIYQFGAVGQVSWSISTEWGFYFTYPFLCILLARLRSMPSKIVFLLILSFFIVFAIRAFVAHLPAVDEYAVRNYGQAAGMTPSVNDSFYRWALYFSPYSRVFEFAVGGTMCAIYLGLADRRVSQLEARLGFAATMLAIVASVIIHVMMFFPGQPFPILTQFSMSFGFALPCGIIILCIARYSNWMTNLFGLKPIVLGGEISYSLYLLHLYIAHWIQMSGYVSTPAATISEGVGRVFAMVALSIFAAALTYRVIEVPGRGLLRRALSDRTGSPQALERADFFSFAARVCTLVCLLLLPAAAMALRPPPTVYAPSAGTVHVLDATYGGNCGASRGNADDQLVESCSGAKSCRYVIDVRGLGDPAQGCPKDFSVHWKCSPGGPIKATSVEAEAGLGSKSVTLSCSDDTHVN